MSKIAVGEVLPLPAGWKAEPVFHSRFALIALQRPGSGGFVTVDFDRRIFSPGHGCPNNVNATSTKTYAGAGWKKAIVEDAVAWLNGVMAGHDGPSSLEART